MRESYLARLAKLEYEQKAGGLVSVADVVAEWEDRITLAKNAM